MPPRSLLSLHEMNGGSDRSENIVLLGGNSCSLQKSDRLRLSRVGKLANRGMILLHSWTNHQSPITSHLPRQPVPLGSESGPSVRQKDRLGDSRRRTRREVAGKAKRVVGRLFGFRVWDRCVGA